MKIGNILNVAEPIIDQAMPFIFQRGINTSAAVMTANYYVFDLQNLYCKLQHGKAIHVGVNNEVGKVAMDKDLARF